MREGKYSPLTDWEWTRGIYGTPGPVDKFFACFKIMMYLMGCFVSKMR